VLIEKLKKRSEPNAIEFELNDVRRSVNTTWSTRWRGNETASEGWGREEIAVENFLTAEARRGNAELASCMTREMKTPSSTSGNGRLQGSKRRHEVRKKR
jgi:hypothetical protein